MKVTDYFASDSDIVLYHGDCLEFLKTIPSERIKLVVTSPPYNIGKKYEKRVRLEEYVEQQRGVIEECVRVLSDNGSICWQVGNHVASGEITPLDVILYPIFKNLGLRLRNRIIWHFEHGLHCSKRFSGRYETIMWFTKSDSYTFNLDAVRVPQKYPGKKYFKGPKAGKLSCHPLGKNPGDLWPIPNVKHNHVEKTTHPCQFPVELVTRLILSLTHPGDWTLDPFMGVGTTAVGSILHGRKSAGAETKEEYVAVALERIKLAKSGKLKVRPMERPIYDPKNPKSYRWVNRRPSEPSSPLLPLGI